MSTVLLDPRAMGALLRSQPVFRTLSEAEGLELATLMDIIELPAGDRLFSIGDAAEDLYLVTRGRIRVTVPNLEGVSVVVGVATSGDLLGEMGLFDHRPRSATGTAEGPAQVVRLKGEVFQQLLQSGHPAVRVLLAALRRKVARRIREVDQRLEAVFASPTGGA